MPKGTLYEKCLLRLIEPIFLLTAWYEMRADREIDSSQLMPLTVPTGPCAKASNLKIIRGRYILIFTTLHVLCEYANENKITLGTGLCLINLNLSTTNCKVIKSQRLTFRYFAMFSSYINTILLLIAHLVYFNVHASINHKSSHNRSVHTYITVAPFAKQFYVLLS